MYQNSVSLRKTETMKVEALVISVILNCPLVVRLAVSTKFATWLVLLETKSDTYHSMQEGTFFGLCAETL